MALKKVQNLKFEEYGLVCRHSNRFEVSGLRSLQVDRMGLGTEGSGLVCVAGR